MATGWAFLIGAGRVRDYRILLAPEFLVTALDYGILDGVAGPGVVAVRTRAGRRLCLVSAVHQLTAEDLDGTEPRDEHGRPLRLIYGYACPDGPVVEPADVDLQLALSTALDVYRRYLTDEEQVTVVPSTPFALRSRTTGWPVEAARSRPTPPATPTGRRRRVAVLVGAAALAAVAVLAVGAGMWRPERPESPPAGCPSPQPSVVEQAPDEPLSSCSPIGSK